MSSKDIRSVLGLIDMILPFPIFFGSFITVFSSEESRFWPHFSYFLTFILFVDRLIISLRQYDISKTPIVKKIWNDKEFHFILVVLTFWYSEIYSLLFYIVLILISGILLLRVIHNKIAPLAGQMESSIQVFTKPLLESEFLLKVLASFEISIIPYLFIYLFTFQSKVFISFLIYTFLYILLCYLTDKYHKFVWSFLYEQINKIARQNESSFGNYLLIILNLFIKLSDIANIIFQPGFFKTHIN